VFFPFGTAWEFTLTVTFHILAVLPMSYNTKVFRPIVVFIAVNMVDTLTGFNPSNNSVDQCPITHVRTG
jgi:hypothetical protein